MCVCSWMFDREMLPKFKDLWFGWRINYRLSCKNYVLTFISSKKATNFEKDFQFDVLALSHGPLPCTGLSFFFEILQNWFFFLKTLFIEDKSEGLYEVSCTKKSPKICTGCRVCACFCFFNLPKIQRGDPYKMSNTETVQNSQV